MISAVNYYTTAQYGIVYIHIYTYIYIYIHNKDNVFTKYRIENKYFQVKHTMP